MTAAASIASLAARLPTDIPVDPDADQAREWLTNELGKPQYQAARPTWFDLVSQAIGDWLASLRLPSGEGLGALVPLIVVLVLVALVVVAFLVFGRPRLNRRSQVATGALFGADDTRSAAELRASAARAAGDGDFTTAIEEAFRALARQLAERTIVMTAPGTTARDFAQRAGVAFPAASAELIACAMLFDGVRYLDRRGTREEFDRVTTLDRRLQAERPVALDRIESEVVR
ncbi:DUF4129 domain-containing protein [Herbiconiux daphne]|uniref:DUF4129 domain-containing protein n=1 Tax=Herbiconiux daphne TaxID=2970914 RepID=A0ABT2H4R2_9MICO|nr:DUF4129 domain-containing protein [Herbiconiux daphne]MCS5734932.1 DUF4129 domain-containing protein [Herbiconiux daphne]